MMNVLFAISLFSHLGWSNTSCHNIKLAEIVVVKIQGHMLVNLRKRRCFSFTVNVQVLLQKACWTSAKFISLINSRISERLYDESLTTVSIMR